MAALLDGKIGLVTGGGSGLGQATALAFARGGAKAVVIADVDAAGGNETCRLVSSAGAQARFVQADVSSAADAARIVDETIAHFGRLDCAVNNAGIGGRIGTTADYDEETWNKVLGVNLTGVWLCLRSELKQMLKQGHGAIVNMASVAGLVGSRIGCAYVASKHGVVGLTKAAAIEYAQANIRVNAVCPSWIETPLTEAVSRNIPGLTAQLAARQPGGRLGTRENVADAVAWLCSDSAAFVTGHALPVDGGLVAQLSSIPLLPAD
jgi:NAD(P)-dependent dehydrogenase (short-subunit alcohol dehydrogenase family)